MACHASPRVCADAPFSGKSCHNGMCAGPGMMGLRSFSGLMCHPPVRFVIRYYLRGSQVGWTWTHCPRNRFMVRQLFSMALPEIKWWRPVADRDRQCTSIPPAPIGMFPMQQLNSELARSRECAGGMDYIPVRNPLSHRRNAMPSAVAIQSPSIDN